MRKHIIQYSKTRDVYVAYRKSGYSQKFLAEHESDIIIHRAAKKAFDDLGIERLPTVVSLNSESAKLNSEKESLYAEYKVARKEMNDLITARQNVDKLFRTVPLQDGEEKQNPHR